MKFYKLKAAKPHVCIYQGFESMAEMIRKKDFVIKKTYNGAYVAERKMRLCDVWIYDLAGEEVEKEKRNLWVDLVTGTLFDPGSGNALSSDQVRLI